MKGKVKQQPLFTVVLIEPGLTVLGFERIEVLGFIPFRAKQARLYCSGPDCDNSIMVWDYESWAIIRTRHGIQRIGEEDLMSEIEEGIYVEEGTPSAEIKKRRKVRRERR